jgi:hypothetical protein
MEKATMGDRISRSRFQHVSVIGYAERRWDRMVERNKGDADRSGKLNAFRKWAFGTKSKQAVSPQPNKNIEPVIVQDKEVYKVEAKEDNKKGRSKGAALAEALVNDKTTNWEYDPLKSELDSWFAQKKVKKQGN